MSDMKALFNKNHRRYRITFKEYAEYRGIPLDDLTPYRK